MINLGENLKNMFLRDRKVQAHCIGMAVSGICVCVQLSDSLMNNFLTIKCITFSGLWVLASGHNYTVITIKLYQNSTSPQSSFASFS